MKHVALLASLLVAAPALSGELFRGSHQYRGKTEVWMPAAGVGYQHFSSVGDIAVSEGPFPKHMQVRCYGASFWSSDRSEAEGICVFGGAGDTWTVRYVMTDTDPQIHRRERFHRIGEWRVVGGMGAYEGMTGSGTYLAEPGDEEAMNVTRWEGEVTRP